MLLACPDTDQTAKLEPQVRTEVTIHLLGEIMNVSSSRNNITTVVTLDNLQWFDRASWSLLLHLIEVCLFSPFAALP
jgi:predicted ATPase